MEHGEYYLLRGGILESRRILLTFRRDLLRIVSGSESKTNKQRAKI
jgi:hypothetical protein